MDGVFHVLTAGEEAEQEDQEQEEQEGVSLAWVPDLSSQVCHSYFRDIAVHVVGRGRGQSRKIRTRISGKVSSLLGSLRFT